jgi:Tfp pilus assembly protein PilV
MPAESFKHTRSLNTATAASDQQGFTLIETAVAMVIMMIAVLGAASLFTFAIKYNSKANDRDLSTAVAQQSLEQLRNVPFTDASLAATTGRSSTVTSAGRPYAVVITIADTTSTLKTITVTSTPSDSGIIGSVALRTQRSSTILGTNR